MARRAHPPAELRRGVRAGFTRKRQLAAPTATLPDGRFVRGSFGSGRGIFHSRGVRAFQDFSQFISRILLPSSVWRNGVSSPTTRVSSICIARDPGVRLRDLAATLGITERSAYGIVADLVEAGYVVKDKDGRRNRYRVEAQLPLPESIGRERTIGEVLALLVDADARRRPRTDQGASCQLKPMATVMTETTSTGRPSPTNWPAPSRTTMLRNPTLAPRDWDRASAALERYDGATCGVAVEFRNPAEA